MIRQWIPRQVKLVANQPITHTPRTGITNALLVLNYSTAATVYLGESSDPSANPEWKIGPGSVAPVILPSKGAPVNLEADANCTINVIEIGSDDLNMVFAMQASITQISGSTDITDRAGRALGKVGLQVAGADNALANPVYSRPAAGVPASTQTGAGAGDLTFKASAGRVFAAVATVDAYLKDGAGNAYFLPAKVPVSFPTPVEMSTSIVINLTAAGDASCQFE